MININHKNLGTINTNEVNIQTEKGKLDLVFSYETIVSFSVSVKDYYDNATIKNYWSVTTGKLLNKCEPNKEARLTDTEFKARLERALKLVNCDNETIVKNEL